MTKMKFYVFGFAGLALLDTAIQIALKLAARATGETAMTAAWLRAAVASPWIYIAIAGYIATFFAWMALLERAPIGSAFAASHLQIITVLIASMLLFHERLTTNQSIGAICIAGGVIVLAVRESRASEPRAAHD